MSASSDCDESEGDDREKDIDYVPPASDDECAPPEKKRKVAVERTSEELEKWPKHRLPIPKQLKGNKMLLQNRFTFIFLCLSVAVPKDFLSWPTHKQVNFVCRERKKLRDPDSVKEQDARAAYRSRISRLRVQSKNKKKKIRSLRKEMKEQTVRIITF